MATEEEVRLGRLAVKQGHATEAQVLDALRERNAKPAGGDLGAILEARGLVTREVLAALRKSVAAGDGKLPLGKPREDQSTDHEISLESTREVIARDQLEEALRISKKQPKAALKELERLAKDFRDTESGVRAEREAKALQAKQKKDSGSA